MAYGFGFNKLLEQELEAGRGLNDYRRLITDLFGIERLSGNKCRFNPQKQDINAAELNLQELAYCFLGRDYKRTLSEQWVPGLLNYHLIESGSGAPVMASQFANISGLVATVVGMLDAIVWQNYNNPQFIGLQIVDVRERRVEGGKIIGVRADTRLETGGLAKGEELPAFGLQEIWVTIPESRRYGGRVQVDQFAFIYDRTDQIIDAAAKLGTKVAHDIEQVIAKAVLGITNTYEYCGTANNFYQSTAGSYPFDYVNQVANPLNDWTAVNTARQLLEGNKDPSGLPITLPLGNVYVMPQKELNARTILRATEILTGTQTSAGGFPLSIRRTENPIGGFDLVPLNRVWYNVAYAALGNVSAAEGLWLYGDTKKAFVWASILPFTTTTAPLAASELARGVALDYQAQQVGSIVQVDPRFICKNTIS